MHPRVTAVPVAALAAEDKVGANSATSVPNQLDIDLGNLRAFVELARSDLRSEKALIVAENLEFPDDEAAEFWPLHLEYDLELNKLLDRRLKLIGQFART